MTLIKWVEVVANMHKLRAIKDLFILLALDISTHESAHPIVSDNDGRENFELAE